VDLRTCPPRARKTTCLAPPPDDGAERRLTPRFRCRLNCYCSPITLTQRIAPWTAFVQDVSSDGIQLVFGHPVPAGTFLCVTLLTPPGQFVRQLRARVIRSRRSEQSPYWTIGCSLNPELSNPELDALL
jgi:hypothetical protein